MHAVSNITSIFEMILVKLVKSFKSKLIPKLNSFVSATFSERYLLFTNVAISVTLSGTGDVLEQNYEMLAHDLEGWDRERTRNMSLFGMTIGIFCHYWYIWLDRRLPGYSVQTVIKKVLADQTVCSPICVATLFLTTGFLENKSREEVLSEIKNKAWILYAAEWTVWPPAQFVNFYFLPTRFRVLYDNTISLGYDVFTSYVKNSKAMNQR